MLCHVICQAQVESQLTSPSSLPAAARSKSAFFLYKCFGKPHKHPRISHPLTVILQDSDEKLPGNTAHSMIFITIFLKKRDSSAIRAVP